MDTSDALEFLDACLRCVRERLAEVTILTDFVCCSQIADNLDCGRGAWCAGWASMDEFSHGAAVGRCGGDWNAVV